MSWIFPITIAFFACSGGVHSVRDTRDTNPGEQPQASPPVYFIKEKDFLLTGSTWNIAIDINITNYYSRLDHFWDSIEEINNLDLGEISVNYVSLAKDIRNVIDNEVMLLRKSARRTHDKLINIVNTLARPINRDKRSFIDIGGDFLHMVFGTLTDSHLKMIQHKIKNMDQKTEGITHLLDSMITYINATYEAGNRNRYDIASLNTALTLLNTQVSKTQDLLKTEKEAYEQSAGYVYGIQSALRTLEYTLFAITEDVSELQTALDITALGRLSNYFLSPFNLLKILSRIEPTLKLGFSFLTNMHLNEMYLYYSIAEVHLATLSDRVRMFISIPMKQHNNYFQLYRPIAMPYQLDLKSASVIIS